jgi:hypothetical protein
VRAEVLIRVDAVTGVDPKVSALAASTRRDAEDIQTVEETAAEAVAMLSKIDEIWALPARSAPERTRSTDVPGLADRARCRALGQAQAALAGLVAGEGVTDGQRQPLAMETGSAARSAA